MAKKPLEIDACAGSQLRDTQGEMLSVEGADISDLQAGKGRWNDNHGKGFFNSIGRITHAKKIFKAEDCEDDRQKYYWEKVKAPYVYVKGYLYDDEDHPNAKAAAAILRNIHKADAPLRLKASVEGGVISRGIADPSLLARTKIHSVALTFTPANNATLVEPLSLNKSEYDEAADMELIKSVIHLAETNVPSFRHIARDASASRVASNIEKIAELMKGDDSIDTPTKQEILQYALEAKIQNNVSKIHEIVEAVKHEEMEKGLKSKIAGAAMLGASMLPAAAPSLNVGEKVPQQSTQAAPTPDYSEANKKFVSGIKSKNPFLYAVAMQESSGGANVAHAKIKTGMHKGHNAGGPWGIMPNTAAYIIKKNPKLAAKYPDLAAKAQDVETNHKFITDVLNARPEVSYDLADSLYRGLKRHHKGDLNKISHSWYYGPGKTDEILQGGGDIGSDEYVQGVNKWYKPPKSHKNRKPAQQQHTAQVNKALMAGYGGAGAPSSRTGGAVFQTEALDMGNGKGLKYVTCDGCGKEQVYSKFQVKCRDCGKSWNLEKLHKIWRGNSK
jgi:hypothetical protein